MSSYQTSTTDPTTLSSTTGRGGFGNVASGGLHHQHPESLQANRAVVDGHNPTSYEHSGGRGGAGNIGFDDGITDTTAPGPHSLNNSTGRGGEGNIHPSVKPGPDGEEMSANYGGRGIYSRDSIHATKVDNNHGDFIKPPTDQHTDVKKPSLVDKVIGTAEKTLGKVTKDPDLVRKGVERKTAGTELGGGVPAQPTL